MAIKQLGKYEILEKLGEGATSEVYRARDTVLGREVALKLLKPAFMADPASFERFTKEAHAAADLFHDHIATVLDIAEADGRYFIVMRLILGESLEKTISRKGSLSWDETVRMARQIGAALDFAHSRGFLHRDVKPSNIILTPQGEYVLTDFGLMRAMMSTGLTSHTGAILGTPPYIAPEIWNDQKANSASDQYALACVVYEALTGKVLFSGETPMAVLTKHIKGPQFPVKWPEGVPEGIGEILQKALAKEPGERFGGVEEFWKALKEVRNQQPPVSDQPSADTKKKMVDDKFMKEPLDTAKPIARKNNIDNSPNAMGQDAIFFRLLDHKKIIFWLWGKTVPICMVVGILIILIYQIVTGNWGTWFYMWTFIPFMVGIGKIIADIHIRDFPLSFRHSFWIVAGLILFLIFGAFHKAWNDFGSYGGLIMSGLLILVFIWIFFLIEIYFQ